MQLLMIEVFETINNPNPTFMNEIFLQRSAPYTLNTLRNVNTFIIHIMYTIKYGIETIQSKGLHIWLSLP